MKADFARRFYRGTVEVGLDAAGHIGPRGSGGGIVIGSRIGVPISVFLQTIEGRRVRVARRYVARRLIVSVRVEPSQDIVEGPIFHNHKNDMVDLVLDGQTLIYHFFK